MEKYILFLLLACFSTTLMATETKLIVRAKARDAKFIGSSLGGAHVIIRNKVNNEILAEGKTVGSTGNTGLIMNTARERGVAIADEQTAHFLASIDIEEPTFISIEVIAPFSGKQAQSRASTDLWLIPGKHILGDGIIIEFPGFIVDVLKPRTHQYIALNDVKDEPFSVKANIVMMCGCVIKEGGIWDSNDIEVKGILKRNGVHFADVEMSLIGTNLFEGNTRILFAGQYELIVYAYNPESGNTGVDKVNYVIYD